MLREEREKRMAEESTIKKKRDRSEGSVMGLQDFLEPSPPPKVEENHMASTALKEISDLKNEIIKLTSSLRTMKGI